MTPSRALLASVLLHAIALAVAATWTPVVSAHAEWHGADRAAMNLSIAAQPDQEATVGFAAPPLPDRETVPETPCADVVPELAPPPAETWSMGFGIASATPEVPREEHRTRNLHTRVPVPARDQPPVAAPPQPTEAAATRSQAPQDGASTEPSAIPGTNVPPRYPFVAWRRHIEGTVVVDLDLDAEGVVVAVRLVTSSGCRVLDEAALQQLVTWRFTPARGPLGPVRCTHRQEVVFRIRDRA